MTSREKTSPTRPSTTQVTVRISELVERCKRYQLLAKLAYNQIAGEVPATQQPMVLMLARQASGFYHRLQEVEQQLASAKDASISLDAVFGAVPDASQLRLSRTGSACHGLLEVAARHAEALTPLYLRLAQLAPVRSQPLFRAMGEQAVAHFIQLKLAANRLRGPAVEVIKAASSSPSPPVPRVTPAPRDAAADEQQQKALRTALVRGEFAIHYQPLLCLEQVQSCGVEVLLRWNHPTRGVVDACEFVANAEHARILIPVGRWMLRTAAMLVKHWESARQAPLRLAVNLSACELEVLDMAHEFRSILNETGFPPAQLDLEIQEDFFPALGGVAQKNLQALRALGCRVVVDRASPRLLEGGLLDSGQIDRIKVPAGRVTGVTAKAEGWLALIAAAQRNRIAITATHVEHRPTLFKMRHLGCDEAQGYAVGQPAPSEFAEGWFAAERRAPWGGGGKDASLPAIDPQLA